MVGHGTPTTNAVDALRARTGAACDSALARILGVSPTTVSRWRTANRVPAHTAQLPARGADMTAADLRKAIALLPDADRRALTLELMTDMLGG